MRRVRIVGESSFIAGVRTKTEKVIAQFLESRMAQSSEKRKGSPEEEPVANSTAASANSKRVRREDLPRDTMTGNSTTRTEAHAERASSHTGLGGGNAQSHADGVHLPRSRATTAASGSGSGMNVDKTVAQVTGSNGGQMAAGRYSTGWTGMD